MEVTLEHLPSMCEAMDANPSTEKKKKKKIKIYLH
jgi:hypothetical protein